MAAGTVTTTEELLGNVKKVTFAWTAGTAGEAGTATGTTTYPYTGNLLKVVTVPGTVGDQPTDDYDITIKDEDGVDVANGQLLNRDDTNTEWVISSLGAVVGDKLTFAVASAGAGKKGVCYAYIGITPIGDEDTAIEDALYGTTGIAAFPAAAAAANNVSLAEVIRYIQASQIGSLANTGGTATLAGILGDPANVSLASSLAKIATASAGGLTATADSLAYGIGEIERHFHGWDRWMCAAAAANGEIHVADRIGSTGTGAFTLTSGNDTWGNWVQVLGSSDTPVVAGGVKYDLHRILVLVANTVAPYFIQVAFGTTGAAALAANTFSSIVINPASNTDKTEALPVMSRRQAAGTKAWMRCWCVGNNAKTLTVMFGLHEYEG